MTRLTDAMSIYNEWLREDLIEDRLEYGREDLEQAYPSIDKLGVDYLMELLDDVRADKPIINLNFPGELIKEVIGEACHQGLDGWTIEESATIGAFLRDIGIACAEYSD